MTSRPLRSRLAAATAALGGTALLLTACSTTSGGGSSEPAAAATLDPDAQYEIVFESYNLGSATWEGPILSLIEQFEAEHPNIDVVTQALGGDSTGAGGTAASVQRQLLAGSPPDVVQMTFDTLDYAVSDLRAQPLDEIVGQDAIDAHLGGEHPVHEKVRDFAVVDGHTYGIPYVLSTPMLWYNSTALAEAGVTDPDFSTWESLREVAETVTAATGSPSFSNSCLDPVGEWCFQSMVRSAGGRVVDADGTIGVGEEPAVAAVTAMQELSEAGLLQDADFTGQYEAFAGGSTQIHINSASMQAAFQAGADAGGWELAAAPMPGFEGEEVVPTSSGSGLFVFSEDPGKQAAAWELVKFLTSETAYETISPQIGYLPLRTTMTEDGGSLAEWAQAQDALLAPNLEQLDSIEPWVAYPGKNYVQIGTIVMDAVDEVAYRGADPASTMQAAAERAQELVEK